MYTVLSFQIVICIEKNILDWNEKKSIFIVTFVNMLPKKKEIRENGNYFSSSLQGQNHAKNR